MSAAEAMQPDTENEHQTVKARMAVPSAVLSFAAPIQAGKTTVSSRLALRLDAPRVSFGDYLRGLASEKGLDVTREVLQDLGDSLVNQDVLAFCGEVLKQQPWKPGRLLIVDGVRHVEILDALGRILTPAKTYLIYINVDRTTQSERLKHDPLPHKNTLDQLEQHSTERQVRNELPYRAAIVLDGTKDPDELTQKIIEFLDSKGEGVFS